MTLDPAIRRSGEVLAAALRRLDSDAGAPGRVARLLLVDEPPSLDAEEITDKAYPVELAILRRRKVLVDRLLAEPPSARPKRPRGRPAAGPRCRRM